MDGRHLRATPLVTLRRLARRYVKYFRREIVREHHFLDAGPLGGRRRSIDPTQSTSFT
jgi:hypothetical protein